MTPTGGNPVGVFFYAADSARRGVTDKFFGFFRLLDACALNGCPACRLVEDDGRRYLDALVYEQVNDPDTRRCIRAAWGFCNWHTWMLLEIPNAPSSAAILYGDLLRVVLDRLRRMRELLVIGHHGHSRIFERTMGSTAQSIVRLAPCPVLVAK